MDLMLAIAGDALIAATPLILAALGALVAERSGVLNLGVEGLMLLGAVSGFAVMHLTGLAVPALVIAALAGAAAAALHGGLVLWLNASQVASGLALALFGAGLASVLGKPFIGEQVPRLPAWPLILLAFLLVAVVALALRYSRVGLILRAVGSDHHSAHALGYPVRRVRLIAVLIGGAGAGLGGAFLSLVHVPHWTEAMTAGRGWIALALVVFAGWRPWLVPLGALLFGTVSILELHVQAWGLQIPSPLMTASPYLATILALAVLSARGGGAAPAMLGQPFRP